MKHTLALMGSFALAAILFNECAQSQVSINPLPSSLDQFITITAPPALTGGRIDLYTSAAAATCSAGGAAAGTAAAVALEPDTSNLALAGGTTNIAIRKGFLLSGNYLCAVVTVTPAAGPPVATLSPAVQITAGIAAGGGAVSISPAPSSSDQFVTVIAPATASGGSIDLYTATSSAACTAAAAKLDPQPNTSNLVQPSGTTAVAIEIGKLISGNYVCAAVTVKPAGGAAVTTLSPAVQVKPAGAVSVAGVTFNSPPTSKDPTLVINTPGYLADDTFTVLTASTAEGCAKSTTTIGTSDAPINGLRTTVAITPGTLKGGNYVCVAVKDASGKVGTTQAVAVNSGCSDRGPYSDCSYEFTLFGGIEQSGLSAQNSITNGFYDLFIRRPVDSNWASIWFRSRFLGSPSTSSTSNVVAAATNPAGTLTASNLPQSVVAVDYVLGMQLWKDMSWGTPKGRLTLAPVIGFGATTPLAANTVVDGFQVPQIGTNECNQLQARFTGKNGYTPPLPGPGYYTNSSGTVVQGCVVEPLQGGTTATATNPGTQITAIVFSNEDRSDFLLKWGAGVRLLDRYAPTCSTSTGCPRMRADFSVGQDEAITGGYLRHWIFKADAVIPIFSTGAYFFASSANRLAANRTLSPLILTPVTVNSGSSASCASSTSSSTSVCVPSPSVFVLPYQQPDRDYYRIGIGIDAVKLLSKLFNPPQG